MSVIVRSTIVLHTPITTPWVLVTIALDAASIERVTEALISPVKSKKASFDLSSTPRVFLHLDTQDKDAVIRGVFV